jgi:hypothetical protein
MAESLEDKMSPEVITERITDHFSVHRPYRSRVRIVRQFLATFSQHAAMTAEEVSEDDDTVAINLAGEQSPE